MWLLPFHPCIILNLFYPITAPTGWHVTPIPSLPHPCDMHLFPPVATPPPFPFLTCDTSPIAASFETCTSPIGAPPPSIPSSVSHVTSLPSLHHLWHVKYGWCWQVEVPSKWREQAVLLYMMIIMTIVTWDYLIYRINLAKYPSLACLLWVMSGKCVCKERERGRERERKQVWVFQGEKERVLLSYQDMLLALKS